LRTRFVWPRTQSIIGVRLAMSAAVDGPSKRAEPHLCGAAEVVRNERTPRNDGRGGAGLVVGCSGHVRSRFLFSGVSGSSRRRARREECEVAERVRTHRQGTERRWVHLHAQGFDALERVVEHDAEGDGRAREQWASHGSNCKQPSTVTVPR
jgi:hypothetical protein